MSKTLVIGSSGKIGRLLVPLLVDAGIEVAAMVRNRSKAPVQAGVEVIEADLEGDFSHAFRGCDRVVFTAGSGPDTGFDKTLLVDLWGARKAIDKAREKGVKQFVMVSSRFSGSPESGPEGLRPYLVAKCFADEYLVASGVPYTILRPGRLTDEKGSGLVTLKRPTEADRQVIPREDTARAIVRSLQAASAIDQTFELYRGDQPLDKAIK